MKIKLLIINKLDATFCLSCIPKATLFLFNTERLIDLCPFRRVLDHNFTVFIDYMCSADPTKKTHERKTKTLFKKQQQHLGV